MRALPRSPLNFAFAFSLIAGSLIAQGGCFLEPGEPPAFRYDCATDNECQDGQSCIASLCQTPCTLLTFETDCPQDGTTVACINGVCASACDPMADSDPCPGEQSCLSIDLPSDSGQFGGQSFAVCGQLCDEAGSPPCPESEACFGGYCVPLDGTTDTDSGGDTGTETTGANG